MRLICFGTSEFAVPALRAVAADIVLVVSQPDRPAGRGRHLKMSPVKAAALGLGLHVETPERSRAQEFVEHVRSLSADALLVASYGQILSTDLLESSVRGGINLHASILPKYRGAAPIQRAILNGETETGITLMQMAKGMDTGDIIAIEQTPIGNDETAGELEIRLASIAATIAAEWMPRICAGEYPRTPQDDAEATLAAKVYPADGVIDWGLSAEEAYRRFRGCTPRPGATLMIGGGPVKVLGCRLVSQSGPKGLVVEIQGDAMLVGFGEGSLELRQVQVPGRPAQSGGSLANGLRLKSGDSLLP